MGSLWKWFFIIWVTRTDSAKSKGFTEELYELTNEIVGRYLEAFGCVTYVAEDVRKGEYLRKEVPGLVINLSVLGGDWGGGGLLSAGFEQGCGGVIVQAEGGRRVEVARALVEAKSVAERYRYNRERYLFLPVSENDTSTSLLLEEKMFFLPNLVLVAPDGPGRFVVLGHRVFEGGEGGEGGGSEVMDKWSRWGGFEGGRDLYPDRLKDVRGKKLVLGMTYYMPYSVIVREGNRTIYDGMESRIAKQFVESINGTYEGQDHPVELWGNKFPNGSGNGIFGSVQRHEADLGYAAIYQWYCDVLDCSYPYIQAEVVCAVPKPRIVTSGMTILLPFSTSTWIAFSIAYLINSTFVICITLVCGRLTGDKNSGGLLPTLFSSAFSIFRLQLHQVPRLAFARNSVATFVKIALLYHFSVSVFWQGGIASILTVPRYEKSIDSAEDLASRWPHMNWGADHNVWIHSIENSTEPALHQIVKKFVILDQDTLVQRAKARDFAFFMERLPNNHYGFSPYINEETVPYLRLTKRNIYTAFAVMILPRGSPYTEKLDSIIHWLFDTGIVQKMLSQVSLERVSNHLQMMLQYSDEKGGGKAILTLGHLKGPMYIYFAGTLTATVVFVAEKLIYLKSYKK